MRVLFLPDAEAEHLGQVAYYESKQVGLGARYLAEVSSALAYIAESPLRFRIARTPDLRRLDLRLFPFAIFFRVDETAVHVAAVAAHRRRPGYWQGRL